MGLLTYSINMTLDGSLDHEAGIADDELHVFFTRLMREAGAILWGRTVYEMMEAAWPPIARDASAPEALRAWAIDLDAKPKYVVSSTRRAFSWNNTFHLEGDLKEAVERLKRDTPQGVLVGSPKLATALEELGLIDAYCFVLHPVFAGHDRGPAMLPGVGRSRRVDLVETSRFASGAIVLHYRRR